MLIAVITVFLIKSISLWLRSSRNISCAVKNGRCGRRSHQTLPSCIRMWSKVHAEPNPRDAQRRRATSEARRTEIKMEKKKGKKRTSLKREMEERRMAMGSVWVSEKKKRKTDEERKGTMARDGKIKIQTERKGKTRERGPARGNDGWV